MYSKILVPEIMASMLPKNFPKDELSQPEYKVKSEKDVYVKMRDGVHVCVEHL